MPYIERERAEALKYDDTAPQNVGELTFVFFWNAKAYGHREPPSYKTHAEVIAALDNAKEEYRRRFLNPYEDIKRLDNGDV